jgi:hypothetical protein
MAKAMAHQISFQPMRVLIDGHDSDGRLILAGDQLAAVIVLLEAEHHSPDTKAKWHQDSRANREYAPAHRPARPR